VWMPTFYINRVRNLLASRRRILAKVKPRGYAPNSVAREAASGSQSRQLNSGNIRPFL
jgi:hypothetical protein